MSVVVERFDAHLVATMLTHVVAVGINQGVAVGLKVDVAVVVCGAFLYVVFFKIKQCAVRHRDNKVAQHQHQCRHHQ